VAGALALKLLPSEQARLAQARPVNPEAHEAYLRGTFHWMRATPADVDRAEKYFDQALEKDPSYAPAYVGRAWVWVVRNQFGVVPPGEAGPKAKAAALLALELDENSAGAHEVLASVRFLIDWDWEGAQKSYLRSIELNPNVASAHGLYAHFLMITGHGEEALVHSERSVILDPYNPLIQSWRAQVLYTQRRYDEAVAAVREAQRIQPESPLAMNILWMIMHQKEGMENEALEAARFVVRAMFNDRGIEASLDEGSAQGGYKEAMRRLAESLITRSTSGIFSLPNDIGNSYLMAGEKDKAVEWLAKGFEIHDPMAPYLACHPLYDDLRPDPRFQELLRKMELPTDLGR
jgi:tetratricopeptide (TPR) repeat protein